MQALEHSTHSLESLCLNAQEHACMDGQSRMHYWIGVLFTFCVCLYLRQVKGLGPCMAARAEL